MIAQVLSEGFVLGFSSGLTCVGTCVPFLVPYLMMDSKRALKENLGAAAYFLSGRLIAYVLVGAGAGFLGGTLRPYVSPRTQAAILILTSILMIGFALHRGFRANLFCSFLGKTVVVKRFPFVLGFLLGFNACPPFLVAFARLFEIGNAFSGALYFFAFFVATTIYILPLFAVIPFFSTERLQKVGQMIALLVGVWFLAVGVRNFL